MPRVARRNAKDSVFTGLFSQPKFLLQLYRVLHPEDSTMTEEGLHTLTLRNVLTDRMYNDLGFLAGDRLLILVEAQSSWSPNILVRVFMYLAQTYQGQFEEQKVNLYGTSRIRLPEPELYVIYTGDRQDRPEELCLNREFFGGRSTALELRVKMLYGTNPTDIVGQYVRFCKVYTRQVREKGRTVEAVQETLRICRDENVLKEYLEEHRKETVDAMMLLFDEDYIWDAFGEEKKQEGIEEGIEKGRILQAIEFYREQNMKDSAIRRKLCAKFHLTPEEAADWMKQASETTDNHS